MYSLSDVDGFAFTGMECPDLTNLQDANLRSSVLSREVGGRVVFSCGPGHALVGPSHSTCQASGEWAQPFPTCKGKK